MHLQRKAKATSDGLDMKNSKKKILNLPNEFQKNQCKTILYSKIWEGDYKLKESPASLCNGFMLWYIIDVEYFYPSLYLSYVPEFPFIEGASLEYASLNLKQKPKNTESLSFIDSLINYYQVEHDNVKQDLQPLFQEISQKCSINDKAKNLVFISEEKSRTDIIKLDLNFIQQGYIQYFEESVITLAHKDKESSILSLSKGLEKQYQGCWICSEGNDGVSSLLMKCKSCRMEVHAKCYGISETSDEWICKTCLEITKEKKVAKTDDLKKTLQACTDQTQISISSICEICKFANGSCVFCSFKGCSIGFHPECGKDQFLTNNNLGKQKLYCTLHKPLQLRKMLETRQKKINDDILKFCKAIEKWEQKSKQQRGIKRKREKKLLIAQSKIFTTVEDQNLEFKIQKFLHKLNVGQNRPFFIQINSNASTRKSRVDVDRPEYFTMIQPEVILENSITIEKRTPEECFKRYQDTLFTRIKNDILLRGDRLSIYYGQSKMLSRYLAKKVKNANSKGTNKRPKQKIQTKSLKQAIPKPIKSREKYCYCNKPFYYKLPCLPEWSQEEYEKKIRENEMIECTLCENWFHFGCIGYAGTLEQAQCDEEWVCSGCSLKRQKIMEVSTNED